MLPGMIFTIEPIVMMKEEINYKLWSDGWTLQDPGNPSCQWEHMILITETGHEILTLREGELIPNKI